MSAFYTSCKNQSVYIMKICDVQDAHTCGAMNTAITVTPRITGFFSMMFVLIVIYRFFATPRDKRRTYDRLMLGMSTMNFFGAFAFFLGQWPFETVPVGAATSPFCTLQAFTLTLNGAVEW